MENYRLEPALAHSLRRAACVTPVGADPREAADNYRSMGLGERTDWLPSGARAHLRAFLSGDTAGASLIRGLPIDDGAIGETPAHWGGIARCRPTIAAERYLASFATVLGEPFTWQTLQAGRMIQDILPIRGDEAAQSGHGSGALLEFHTEDGFHPNRCDYLLLLGMRNHDRVPTFIASIQDVSLDPSYWDVLFEPRFHILPDDEHIKQLGRDNPNHPELREVLEMRDTPPAVSVLFGVRADPYLRIDYPFMRPVRRDWLAHAALDALMAELYRVKRDIVVEQGDLLVVDNYRAVHGRASFQTRYDGRDRWLKRMIVRRTLPRRGAG